MSQQDRKYVEPDGDFVDIHVEPGKTYIFGSCIEGPVSFVRLTDDNARDLRDLLNREFPA